MNKTADLDPADFIAPLNMDGLAGRMLVLPCKSRTRSRDILFIYGQHSSLERWWGLIQDLSRYGTVTAPDLPGFGGMESLYKIGKKPTFDELADYLAAFVKLRYKRKRLTIVGLSIGFPIVTRMLQRYPDLAKNVDLLISVVGFAHHDDFIFSKRRQVFYKYGARFFVHRPLNLFLQYVCLNPVILRQVYHRTRNAQEKFENKTPEEFDRTMDMELFLWKINDLRTWMQSTIEMLSLDNCRQQVDLPVWHISVKDDHYFDEHLVEQHYRVIFTEFHHMQSSADSHGPSVIATAKDAAKVIPPKLRQILAKS